MMIDDDVDEWRPKADMSYPFKTSPPFLFPGPTNNLETRENQDTSPQNSSSSSETCSPNTVKSNTTGHSMNDALIADGDLSNDTTLSSLSDMSASASFNEASIAFSSTCIKIPEATSVDDSAVVDPQEVDPQEVD